MDLNKNIWEGWTAQNFIDELEDCIPRDRFKTREEVKAWCMDNQPYYKKYVKDVVDYFCKQLNIK